MNKILFILFLFVASFQIALAGGICDDSTLVCGQQIISSDPLTEIPLPQEGGYGAVELCETCFVCGAADGICPEDYSTGQIETRAALTKSLIKVGPQDRPPGEVFSSSTYRTLYLTGNNACEAILGECSSIESSEDGENWQSTSISCDTGLSSPSYNLYYRAQCDNVMRTATCHECPDPDCTASLTGLAYDLSTQSLIQDNEVNVILTPVNNQENHDYLSITTNTGRFSTTEIPRGNMNYQCNANNYNPISGTIRINRGQNVIDCAFEEQAQCTAECTLPDASGFDICRASCDDLNDCGYPEPLTWNGNSYNTKELCDGRRVDSFLTFGRHNSTHIAGVTCCTGELDFKFRPQFNLIDDNLTDVRNIITRDYSRVLGDESVTVRIIVYERN